MREALGQALHLGNHGPWRVRAAFLPKPRNRSGSPLRGAPRSWPHLGDALLSGLARWARARGSPGSPSGAGRDHSAWTAGGRLRVRKAAGTSLTGMGCGRGHGHGLCRAEGRRLPRGLGLPGARREADVLPPVPPPRVGRGELGGSRSAPPSRAICSQSPGIWRRPRARRGRARPLPLPARSPPPRVPSRARGAAGSPLRSRSCGG